MKYAFLLTFLFAAFTLTEARRRKVKLDCACGLEASTWNFICKGSQCRSMTISEMKLMEQMIIYFIMKGTPQDAVVSGIGHSKYPKEIFEVDKAAIKEVPQELDFAEPAPQQELEILEQNENENENENGNDNDNGKDNENENENDKENENQIENDNDNDKENENQIENENENEPENEIPTEPPKTFLSMMPWQNVPNKNENGNDNENENENENQIGNENDNDKENENQIENENENEPENEIPTEAPKTFLSMMP